LQLLADRLKPHADHIGQTCLTCRAFLVWYGVAVGVVVGCVAGIALASLYFILNVS
jgi:hypothetical protein